MSHQTSLPWNDSKWLTSAVQWIQAELAAQNISVTGKIEQPHVRPWSTVLKVPTSMGHYYFKASAPVLFHEVRLTLELARRRPDCMPKVIAADPDEGWMLMSDGGPTLRRWVGDDRYLSHWLKVITIYAELQLEMIEHQSELIRVGLFDRRLALLPGLLESLLNDEAALLIDEPDGLTRRQYVLLRDHVVLFEQFCRQLADYSIPETLQHDDFHDNNIFVNSNGYTFFDWAETCIAHPFFTMVVTPRSVAYQLGVKSDDPRILLLRDAYLEPWSRFAPKRPLLEVYQLANRIGMINRALTWYQVLKDLPESERMGEESAVPGWLQEYMLASGWPE